MPFAEDFAPFFDVSGFATVTTWNGATTVNAIFDRAYAEPLGGLVEGVAPVLWCEAATVPGVKHNDTFVIDGTTYKVRGVEPDGTGVVLLRLEEQ